MPHEAIVHWRCSWCGGFGEQIEPNFWEDVYALPSVGTALHEFHQCLSEIPGKEVGQWRIGERYDD